MRIHGRIKMGHYPTPPRVVELIRNYLSLPASPFTALDPCCGEGHALAALVTRTSATTYGVELDHQRAEESKTRLYHVLRCGIEETRIQHRSCSLLLLNPPYDELNLDEEADVKTERQERAFLRMTAPYLIPGGILVYIIPQNRLDKAVARLLASRFERINVFRFPDPEFEDFKQIIVLGIKKADNMLDEGEALPLARVPKMDLPILSDNADIQYQIPVSGPLTLFRSTLIDPEELAKHMAQSPLWKRFAALTTRTEIRIPRPPLPLHSGHLGLLLAAGKLDGIVGTGDEAHLVKGRVRKITTVLQEVKGEVLEERELDRYVVSIKILSRHGEIRELT
ncbi:MAG: class I SAM-dependent methyltransferase [Deltaproteobacteria bacterium]|nr:class I SAM-dependent methyltransferase [Deltaproteobacteria bacterium]